MTTFKGHPRAAPIQRARVLGSGARARRVAASDAAATRSESNVVLDRLLSDLPKGAAMPEVIAKLNDVLAALRAAQGFRR